MIFTSYYYPATSYSAEFLRYLFKQDSMFYLYPRFDSTKLSNSHNITMKLIEVSNKYIDDSKGDGKVYDWAIGFWKLLDY